MTNCSLSRASAESSSIHLEVELLATARAPEGVMEDWVNSSGYRDNILNPSFRGIGVSSVYSSTSNWEHY